MSIRYACFGNVAHRGALAAMLAVGVMAMALSPGCGKGIGVSGADSGSGDASGIDPDGNTDGGPTCGNGVLDPGEACDGADLGGSDCVAQGFTGGTLACTTSCTFDNSGCVGGCGNDLAEGTEECDGADLDGGDCASVSGHADGVLVCAADCSFDESGCATCGDAVAGGTEACDGADLGGASCNSLGWNQGTLACATDCTFDDSDCHTCGDGVVGGPEVCDGADLGGETCATQGFTEGPLACTANCLFDTTGCSTCGDGIVSGPEECDGINLGGATCETLGYLPGGSLSCTAGCLFDRSVCTPSVCTVQSATNPLGRAALQFHVHPTVDIQLATEAGAVIQDAGPVAAGVNQAAVTFDQLQTTSGSAGFLFTRAPATTELLPEVVDLLSRLPGVTGVTTTEIYSPGSPTLSHDDYDSVVSALATLTTGASTNLSTLRNNVLAALFGLPVAGFNLPGAGGPSGTQFVVSFAVQWRPLGFVAVVGAVALQSDYDAGGETTFQVDDAGGGTGLAEASATSDVLCFRYDQTSLPQADIIWVLDETGSMTAKLQEIATESVSFFNTAAAYGLDFRMGVVNVEPSNNGVFCTGANQSADHFLGPSDLSAFQACVQAPWGAGAQAGGLEYGITQGENALNGHLPRAVAPDRVRPDATLAIIYVSDERAQELKDDCGATGTGMVAIDPVCLQNIIGPTIALLEPNHPIRPGRAYSLIQPPPIGCGSFSEVGQGYLDISNATGGQTHSICPTDLGPFMNAVLQDIIAAAAPTKLPHRPISASLAVAKLDRSVTPAVSLPLARSRTDGFDYRPSSNGVVFLNQDFSQLPYEMVISYEHWLSTERCWNGADDDGDGLVDCADTADCAGAQCGALGQTCQGTACVCPGGATETTCGDGVDNDCDGQVDCADVDCNGVFPCEQPESTCDDGIDNDADGAVDCADSDCPTLASETSCADGYDNDCDGAPDCADADCNGVGSCEQPEVSCSDGIDNDGDGLIDGADLMDCGSAVYQDVFNTNPATWTFTCEWEWGVPSGTVGPASCVSGSCIGLDLDDNYDNNHAWGACHVTSPPISLVGTTNPSLVFQSWMDTEGSIYDGCNLKINTGGATWPIVTGVTPGYNLTVSTEQAWGGHGFIGWQPFTADLTPYVNQTIQLRFECRTDSSITYAGWYIDDLIILD